MSAIRDEEAVQLKGTGFGAMESSVRLTNAQVAVVYTLIEHPVVQGLAADEIRDHLPPLGERLLTALANDVEAYLA